VLPLSSSILQIRTRVKPELKCKSAQKESWNRSAHFGAADEQYRVKKMIRSYHFLVEK
jgi:hypothetical protein